MIYEDLRNSALRLEDRANNLKYPPKARAYIVCIAFKDLPWGVKIIN